jgi:hypothetical protein
LGASAIVAEHGAQFGRVDDIDGLLGLAGVLGALEQLAGGTVAASSLTRAAPGSSTVTRILA